jgi:hypothetical protein
MTFPEKHRGNTMHMNEEQTETPNQRAASDAAERKEREALFLKEHKAQAEAWEPTGSGHYLNFCGTAHKPVKMLPTTGSDPDDDMKA